jgi:hypothetical protein
MPEVVGGTFCETTRFSSRLPIVKRKLLTFTRPFDCRKALYQVERVGRVTAKRRNETKKEKRRSKIRSRSVRGCFPGEAGSRGAFSIDVEVRRRQSGGGEEPNLDFSLSMLRSSPFSRSIAATLRTRTFSTTTINMAPRLSQSLFPLRPLPFCPHNVIMLQLTLSGLALNRSHHVQGQGR